MDEPLEDLPLFSYQTPSSVSDSETATPLKPDSSLSAAINAWGEALEAQSRSIHTVKAFTGDLRLVGKFVGTGQPINQISTTDLKNFLDWMLNRRGVSCSPKTYARRITSIKAFYRWLVGTGVLHEDSAAPIPQQSVISPLPEVLTLEEVDAVIKTAELMRKGADPDARPYTLVKLLLDTGIKKGECLNIHLNHVDLKAVDGPILFIRYGSVSKRYKERKLNLTSEWVEAYQEYVKKYEPVNQLFPWSPRRLEYLLEDIGKAAAMDKHLSFEMCRWTAVLIDYIDGLDHDRIRQKLGISKIQWREVGNKLHRLAGKNS